MDVVIVSLAVANTGLLVWIAYKLGALSKTVNFIEHNCPLFKGKADVDRGRNSKGD